MPVFTFYLHESRDATPSFEIALLDDLSFAMEHGKRILKERPRYSFVEIVAEDAKVAELTRDALEEDQPL